MYLFRIEGVNLSSIYDTTELSVIRGTSFMLRHCTKEISTIGGDKFTAISVGASIGLYQYSDNDSDALQEKIITHINNKYPYITFVVNYIKYNQEDDFKSQLDSLIALNRHQQFKQATIYTQEPNNSNKACEATKIYACSEREIKKSEDKIQCVSSYTYARYVFGRDKRQKFYNDELNNQCQYKFTNDLGQIAQIEGEKFGNLNNKIAVIYIDGNSFSSKLQKCSDASTLSKVDGQIQSDRRSFLQKLIDLASSDEDFKTMISIKDKKEEKEEEVLRLETLLWGGDEMTLVVPAWKGLEVLNLFYEVSKDWKFTINNEEIPLTHASGIVFSHHKTPIKQLVSTAKDLAELAKEESREQNLCHYLALESEYYPTEERLKSFFAKRYLQKAAEIKAIKFPLTKDNEKYIDFRKKIAKKIQLAPKSSLYLAALFYLEGNMKLAKDKLKSAKKELEDNDLMVFYNKEEQEYQNLVHLLELWDYLIAGEKS